jgi:hypothetical protein
MISLKSPCQTVDTVDDPTGQCLNPNSVLLFIKAFFPHKYSYHIILTKALCSARNRGAEEQIQMTTKVLDDPMAAMRSEVVTDGSKTHTPQIPRSEPYVPFVTFRS